MQRAKNVSTMSKLTAVVLAAGDATRMRSRQPKVLLPLWGRALIDYPLAAIRALGARPVVVVGRGAVEVMRHVGGEGEVVFVEQLDRRGTGHAVLQAREACGGDPGTILVLPGDMPLLAEGTLRRLVEHHQETGAAVTILSAELEDPTGYGRVVREKGHPVAIVEQRDATAAQQAIREVGTSAYCFDSAQLWPALSRVTPRNQQGEYYLTDAVAILKASGGRVEAVVVEDPRDGLGVNDRKQYAGVAAVMRERILDRLMADGVTVIDPANTYVDDTVAVGPDTVIYPGVLLEGHTTVGAECVIGAGSHVRRSQIGDRVTLLSYCVIGESTVEEGATLGPFCHLRPLSHVGAGAKIGNFVELKKSRIGRGSKVPHLSYVGDATLGAGVNFGAGAIICNYDGVTKHRTEIGDASFIGTNSSLVAPLTVGESAYVGAGSVVTKDVPPGALAVTRAQQVIREGWVERKQKKRRPTNETE